MIAGTGRDRVEEGCCDGVTEFRTVSAVKHSEAWEEDEGQRREARVLTAPLLIEKDYGTA